jgi:hypothetical protein
MHGRLTGSRGESETWLVTISTGRVSTGTGRLVEIVEEIPFSGPVDSGNFYFAYNPLLEAPELRLFFTDTSSSSKLRQEYGLIQPSYLLDG